ncbi:MAG: electron transfer flavoprotein subunit alpha/FixB family protein [Acidimicrobiales bacterium]
MSNDIIVVVEHDGQEVSDITFELLGLGRELAAPSGGEVRALLVGDASLANQLAAADVVFNVDEPEVKGYSPEGFELALRHVVNEHEPRLVLVGTSTIGIDLAGALSVSWDAPLVSYVIGLVNEGTGLVATSQIYGGKLLAETLIDSPKAICAVIGGSFPAESGKVSGNPRVVPIKPPDLSATRTSFVAAHAPESGGIDITVADMLVSVGRGIASQDNLALVQELADVLGVPLAASRPVIDQGWLPKPQQVGKSGMKVKPRAYLAFGISGAPEHLEGMRNADLIIACNTDANAPIFEIAQYGTTLDLFDLVPALVEALQE